MFVVVAWYEWSNPKLYLVITTSGCIGASLCMHTVSASFVYRIVSTHQQIHQSPLLYVFFSEVVLLFAIIMKHSFWLSHYFQRVCWSFSVIFVSRTKTEEDPRTAGSCKLEGNWAHLGKQRDARGKCQSRLRDRFRRRHIERSSRVHAREKNHGMRDAGEGSMSEVWD